MSISVETFIFADVKGSIVKGAVSKQSVFTEQWAVEN